MKMLPNRQPPPPPAPENPLWVSWHDTQMIATLSPQTVMDYFCRKSNPFYDRVCNNETVRMQRLSLDHLNNMTGVEYILLHVAEPILYVIRKQHRYSPTEATPIADYYIIGGMVYKAPDLMSVINFRIHSAISSLGAAFEEAQSYTRYHPNKGYSWDFTTNKALSEKYRTVKKKENSVNKEEPATAFQVQRVDMLLAEMLRKFPPAIPPIIQQQHMQQQHLQQQHLQQQAMLQNEESGATSNTNNPTEGSPGETHTVADTKLENVDMKPPPEKKMKT